MITNSTNILYEALILALIAQTFAGVLPHTPLRRHLSRRAIDDATRSVEFTTSDHDIAATAVTDPSDPNTTSISGDEVGLISKSAEGESGNVNANASASVSAFETAGSESENIQSVKSTKLLPALGNHDASTGEHKSGETLVLNRVESHEAENTKEVMKESMIKVKEGIANDSTGHHTASEVTNKPADTRELSEEQQELNTGRAKHVFSQADKWLGKPMPTVNLEKHIKNGLDEMTLRENEERQVNAVSIDDKTEQPATTEEILKDLEDIAVKLNMPTTHRTENVNSMLKSKVEGGHDAFGLEESMGRSMGAVHSSENKLEVAFGEKRMGDEIEATKTSMLQTKTNVEGNTKVSEQSDSDVHSNQQRTEAEITKNPIEVNIKTNEASEAETESLVGIVTKPTVTKEESQINLHINNTSSAEKRAKFFNDNTTSSQMNLPDGPEVWSLAGMRMVPKAPNINGTPLLDNKSTDLRWQANEILTTERTMNVSDYSEKNLLDWTKVMGMRSELESEGTVGKNLLTGNALEEDKIDSVKSPKIELPLQMAEKWLTDGPSKINASVENVIATHQTTEGFAMLNVGHEFSATQTMNEIDTTHTVTKTTAIPTITTNPPTTQTTLSSDSPLSIDNNDKRADFTSTVVTAGIREPLNEFSTMATETSAPRTNAEMAGAEKINATELSTQRQPSEDFNFIITSTTPGAMLDVAAGVATEMPISNETTTKQTSTATAMLAALPVEQSTSTTTTTTTPPPSDVSEAPTRWDNATALEAQPETTEATLLSNVDAGVSSTNVDMSSGDGMHNVTLEQQLKREPETVTETANATEEQATLLTVSEQSTSEVNGPTSASEKTSSVNASASTETVEGIATQNEIPSVTTVTTTESSHITETAPNTLINTELSTDLVETNANAKTSEVLAVTTAATTTEASHIGNEVELEVRTEHITDAAEGPTDATSATTLNSDTGSSTIEKLEETVTNINETNTTAKTVPSINELLVPVNKTTTTSPSTTELPITTPPTQFAVEPVLYAATTLKSDENVNEETTTTVIPLEITTVRVQASGPVLENSTTTTNTLTPVDFRNHTTVAEGTHDTESSIETNVIDQLDKTTVKITSTATLAPTTVTDLGVAKVDGGEKNSTEASHVVSVFDVSNATTLPSVQEGETATAIRTSSTTMATIAINPDSTSMPSITGVTNTSNVSTTTEPPLINLLDESTTAASTTQISILNQPPTITSSIAVNPQEVYTVYSTTEASTSTSTSTAAISPLVPIITTTSSPSPPVDSSTNAYIPKVASTIATLTTTMLPPTLHAAIGGGNSGSTPSHVPGMINSDMRPNSSEANETDVNVIIAITVSIIGVVALILLVAFLYLMRKRQKQMSYGQRCRPVSLDAYSLDNVSVLGSVRRKGALRASKRSYGNIAFDDPSLRHNALSASELGKFIERRSSIFEEFRDVPQIIARADEVPAGCEDKNRYANVTPLPETRVVLQQLGDDDKTEYINANYVRGPKDSPNYYIATQAPLETTVADFWRMIWEQQSRVIIQATDLYENGIEKCAEYLPPSVTLDNHTTYGDFQITLKHREVKDKYAISTLMLKNTAENMSRELTHYWYKWPEAGVPNEEAPIIAMLLEARSSLKGYVNEAREKNSNATLNVDGNGHGDIVHNGNGTTVITVDDDVPNKLGTERVSGEGKESGGNVEINGNVSGVDKMKGTTLKNQGPLTIHCSPGTGRTGTIIACDMAIRSLETPKRSVDIPQIVYYVRRGRASAVQTKEQYEFIYKVAHMYATKITNLSNDN
ncbi:mucin-17 isoform X1 [Bactrocera tryoni]|uniref:mucin-17 isoform X1 n=1 Tax=Bactrocera tryoni TaxID=59916 RepID=UPI001A970FBE|nr:mucin-17 isoform X1 [Bactrocera tryoni]XP_039971143.1 mucin-17 isoform X1 [Bactrocera tryoni]